jgi:hypothetical protein
MYKSDQISSPVLVTNEYTKKTLGIVFFKGNEFSSLVTIDRPQENTFAVGAF